MLRLLGGELPGSVVSPCMHTMPSKRLTMPPPCEDRCTFSLLSSFRSNRAGLLNPLDFFVSSAPSTSGCRRTDRSGTLPSWCKRTQLVAHPLLGAGRSLRSFRCRRRSIRDWLGAVSLLLLRNTEIGIYPVLRALQVIMGYSLVFSSAAVRTSLSDSARSL